MLVNYGRVKESFKVIKAYCQLTVNKNKWGWYVSTFEKNCNMKKYFSFFHDQGVDIVCLTLVVKELNYPKKEKKLYMPAIKNW
jgi:fructokinase